MKILKRTLCLVMCLVMAFSSMVIVGAKDTAEEVTGFTQEDTLRVKGTKIVNQKGEKIKLKGVNLGAWLIFEDWLTPYETKEAADNYEVIEILIDRFGVEKAYAALDQYYRNWITEEDLDNIKEMGFNCVRVPFWYRNFYYGDTMDTKILDENGQWDFSILEWVVEECSKREIYVVLDMHGAPGFQGNAGHSGKLDSCTLYDDTEQGEYNRKMTEELWAGIAAKFKGNLAVAMYDLLNEPMCEVEASEFDRRANNTALFSRLYKAVREVDPDHIITLESIWTGLGLPHSYLQGWKNVVYQVHFYETSDFVFTFFCMMAKMWHFNVPMMMGEFYPREATTWENCMRTLNFCGYHWFLWTYKAANHGMWESDWCLYGAKNGFHRAKIASGTYEEILDAWSAERLNTSTGFQDTGHYDKNIKDYIK